MPRKLKINFLLHNPSIGGGDRVVAIYARYLKRAGHEVTLTALRPKRAPWSRRLKRFLRTGRDMKGNFTTALFDSADVDVNAVVGKSRLDDNDVPDGDILIATYWLTAEWALGMSPEKGAKVYFVQNNESEFPYAPKERVNATYTAPLYKIVICKWLDRLMREKFGHAPAANIPNSVDMNQFYAEPRDKNSPPRIGFLYSNNPIKGVDVALAVIEKMQRAMPALSVLAFGTGHATRALPLPPNCKFYHKPSQEKIRDLYAQCDVWISGSRVEGFNLPPLEAMACRTPVVTTSAGAMPELVQNGVQGFVVPVEDAQTLAEKALFVLNLSNDDWRRMSDAAYETATRYTWGDAGALFEKALYDIASAEGRVSS